jgi:probable HAF family extracellular repeat protein
MRHGRLFWITGTAMLALLAAPFMSLAQEQAQDHPAKHRHYKAVDLGTFGGPESYINPASVAGSPNQINEKGTAVGGSATSIPTTPVSNGFVCFGPGGIVPFVNHAFERRNGVMTDLGALGEADSCSDATSINETGQIAGVAENGVLDPILGVTQIRAVVWKHGEIQDLGTLGGNHSGATSNNDRGQVAGFALNATDDPFSFFDLLLNGNSGGTQTRAFLWQDGQMRDLGTLGGPDATAVALNNRGQVAGGSYTNSAPNPTTGLPTTDPFLWEDGYMTDLGTLGGTFGLSEGLNNRGQVFGISNLAGDQVADPFLWDGRKLIDLYAETTGGNFWTANAINDAGRIVGAADFSSTGGSGFGAGLWKNGKAVNLGTLSGDCYSEAIAINSGSQAVGVSIACDTFDQRAFLWEKGSMIDLNTKTPPGFSLVLASAVSINERGEIGGFGLPAGCTDVDACSHAFLLIPREGDDDETDEVAAASQNDAATIAQNSTSVTHAALTPETLAKLRSRFANRHRGFGFGPMTKAN